MRSTADTEFERFRTDLWGGRTPNDRRTGRESELDYGPGSGGVRPHDPAAERALVQAAIRRGVTDETGLTNLVFFQRYPARHGRLISRNEPNFRNLSREWVGIRDTVVRPVLGAILGGDRAATGLRCTRLAGDRELAAVLAGRLRLAAPGTSPLPAPVRSSGPAVKKIQEVLISAGYPLPRSGADGRFGRETAAAVSRFKADRRIEPPDPVVGPATIRALNVSCLLLEGDRGRMIDVSRATRYIAVACPSTTTNKEWKEARPKRSLPLPVQNDYALMKVLYRLRRLRTETVDVHAFQYDEPVMVPLDFSRLRDSDVIFIAGHGDAQGLYTMGPNTRKGVGRLVEILTGDGNLKKLRRNKSITILLLSCQAGLGFHKTLARELSKALARNTTVGGALGFTFGSNRTAFTARNEVLIRGIPWYMEYSDSIPVSDAEQETSAREGRTITVAAKKSEIDQFGQDKQALEKGMQAIVEQLRSTEVNQALNEIETRFPRRWSSLLQAQFELYALARRASNLEFDMWFDNIADGYQWTDATSTTDQEVDALLAGGLEPVDATTLTCTR